VSDATIIEGDSRVVLPTFDDESFDALVCDPPAGVTFLSKSWDDPRKMDGTLAGRLPASGLPAARNPSCRTCGGRKRAGTATKMCECEDPDWNDLEWRIRDRTAFIAFLVPIFSECLRVLKPGAHGLVWALPRTSHWTATALEDAGFEIRDVGVHLFGQGWPKSKGVLKPSGEHWIVCRKAVDGSAKDNVEKYGTGVLNTDACLLKTDDSLNGGAYSGGSRPSSMTGQTGMAGGAGSMLEFGSGRLPPESFQQPFGRRPGNVTFEHRPECRKEVENWTCAPDCAVSMLGMQSGVRTSGALNADTLRTTDGGYSGGRKGMRVSETDLNTNSGSASRFFYCSKAPTRERWGYCSVCECVFSMDSATEHRHGRDDVVFVLHPTVKPQGLMQWLCRLVTPKCGKILDPFAGTGSTGVAAVAEGFSFTGIEREHEYVEIARHRIREAVLPLFRTNP